ncbi:hypothetical protein [Dyella jiangningensis]
MSRKKGGQSNFRVVVDPRGLGDFGYIRTSATFLYGTTPEAYARIERDMRERCEEIAKDIKRHVDNVSYVSVESDTDYVCEHCGSEWTESSSSYNGGCCDKDEECAPREEEA